MWCTMVLCFISSCRPSPNLVRLLGHLKQSSSSPPSITSPWLDPCYAELAEELLELAEVGPGGGEDAVLHHLEEAVHGGALPPPWWGSSRAAVWCRCLLGPVRHTLHRTSCTGQECRRTGVPGDRGRAASREFKYTPFLGFFFQNCQVLHRFGNLFSSVFTPFWALFGPY